MPSGSVAEQVQEGSPTHSQRALRSVSMRPAAGHGSLDMAEDLAATPEALQVGHHAFLLVISARL